MLVYLNILTQSIEITDSMFLATFLQKNAITFDQKEIERKKKYLVYMKFCCASTAAIKIFKTAIKKYFQQNRHLFTKIQLFRKYKFYFQILEVLPVILTTYLPV